MAQFWVVTAVIRTTDIIGVNSPYMRLPFTVEHDTFIDRYTAITPSRDNALRAAEEYFYGKHGLDKDVILVGATSVIFG